MPEAKFWDILDFHLLNPSIPRLRPSNGFYPSEASVEYENSKGEIVVEGACLKQLWYKKKGVKPDSEIPANDLWKMKVGDATHEMIVEAAKRAGIYVGDEIEFWDSENRVSGRVDLIVRHPESKTIIGIEIKSISGYNSVRQVMNPAYGKRPEPRREHILQAALYLDWFSKSQNVHEWRIVYIARDDGQHTEFVLRLGKDKEVLVDGYPTGIKTADIHTRFRKLQDYVDHDMVPPRDYMLQYPMPKLIEMAKGGELGNKQAEEVLKKGKQIEKGDWNCAWCPFKATCWGITEEN